MIIHIYIYCWYIKIICYSKIRSISFSSLFIHLKLFHLSLRAADLELLSLESIGLKINIEGQHFETRKQLINLFKMTLVFEKNKH